MSKRPAPADEPELAFAPGQQVTFTVLSDAGADGSYRVRLDSGEVFDLTPRQWRQEHAPAEQDAMATSSTANLGGHLLARMVFTPGQRVIIIAPVLSPHLGKQGSIQGPIAGQDSWQVRLDCGSVFNFMAQNLGRVHQTLSSDHPSRLEVLERRMVAFEHRMQTMQEELDSIN